VLTAAHGATRAPTTARLTAAVLKCEQSVGDGRISAEILSSTDECCKS
jgi:hypothetical protein